MKITARIMGLLVGLLMLSFGSAAIAAPAASQVPVASTSSTAGEYQEAAYSDRVCCKRHGNDWWSTRRACFRAGGHEVANWQCRDRISDDRRVCCKRGRAEWWANSGRNCRYRGGHVVADRACRFD